MRSSSHVKSTCWMLRKRRAAPLTFAVRSKKEDMKELTSLCVRIAGLLLIVFSLLQVPTLFIGYMSQIENSILGFSLPIIFPLLVGVILFKFPNSFSDTYISLNTNELEKLNINEYLQLGLILIGVILVFYSLSDLVVHITDYFFLKNKTGATPTILNYDYPILIATIVEFMFSIFLILKPKSVIVFIRKNSNDS